jgi:hypothetical protein
MILPPIPFATMPAAARAWVFGAAQPVIGADAQRLLGGVDSFLRGWAAHGAPVVGARDWRHDHFLIVAADEEATGVSGCSIDALFRTLKWAEGEIGITLLDSSLVWFRNTEGSVQAVQRSEFRELVGRGEVTDRTIVFDNTVGTVGGLHAGEWERPFAEAWHARAFAPAHRRQ